MSSNENVILDKVLCDIQEIIFLLEDIEINVDEIKELRTKLENKLESLKPISRKFTKFLMEN